MRRLVWLVVGLSLAGSRAFAECSPPSPPPAASRPKAPQPPPRPVCAGVQNCTRIDSDIHAHRVEAYETALAAFQRDAEAYVAKLKAYAEGALDYARCEASRLDEG